MFWEFPPHPLVKPHGGGIPKIRKLGSTPYFGNVHIHGHKV